MSSLGIGRSCRGVASRTAPCRGAASAPPAAGSAWSRSRSQLFEPDNEEIRPVGGRCPAGAVEHLQPCTARQGNRRIVQHLSVRGRHPGRVRIPPLYPHTGQMHLTVRSDPRLDLLACRGRRQRQRVRRRATRRRGNARHEQQSGALFVSCQARKCCPPPNVAFGAIRKAEPTSTRLSVCRWSRPPPGSPPRNHRGNRPRSAEFPGVNGSFGSRPPGTCPR